MLSSETSYSDNILPCGTTKLPVYGEASPSPHLPASTLIDDFVANSNASDSGEADTDEVIAEHVCAEIDNINKSLKSVVQIVKQLREIENKSEEEDIGPRLDHESVRAPRQESYSEWRKRQRILTDGQIGRATVSPGRVSKLKARFENMGLHLD